MRYLTAFLFGLGCSMFGAAFGVHSTDGLHNISAKGHGYFRVYNVIEMFDSETGEEVYWLTAGKMYATKISETKTEKIFALVEPDVEENLRLFKVKRSELRAPRGHSFVLKYDNNGIHLAEEPVRIVRSKQ